MDKNCSGQGSLAFGQQMNLLAVSLANAVAEGKVPMNLSFFPQFYSL